MQTLLQIGLSNAAAAAGLALLACAVGLLVRKPAVTHGLWLLVLLKLVSPPLWTIPLHISGPSETATSPASLHLDRAPTVTRSHRPTEIKQSDILESTVPPLDDAALPAGGADRVIPWAQLETAPRPPAAPAKPSSYPWPWVLLAVWLGGTTICTIISIGRLVCFRRMMLNCAVPAPQAIQRQARALSRRLGMRNCPDVWLVPGELSPMLWAAGRATWVVLPHGLLQRLDQYQQATLLAHELAHLRRRDHWVRYLELITTCLYWWHPVCWWARRELREAGEQCCDAWVLWALPGSFRKYATALLEAIEFLSRPRSSVPLLASGLGQFGQLKRRLTMLKRGTVSKALTWRGLCGLSGAAALLLPLVPTLAQKADEPRKDDSTAQVEQSANRIRAAAGQATVEPEDADEANAKQQERAEAEAERAQADAERAQALADEKEVQAEVEQQQKQAEAEQKQAERQEVVQQAVERAQALAEQAAAAAQEQYAKAMAEAQQAIESAAKEQQEKGGDDGDAQRSKEEFRNIARQAQREAARAMEQAKREMAQAMGEVKRAMVEAKRQAEQAQREAMRNVHDGQSDLRRQLEDAHRQIRELSKRLAEAQQQLSGGARRGRADNRSDSQSERDRGTRGQSPSPEQREERLQKLEQELQSLLGEVRSMQQERGNSPQERAH